MLGTPATVRAALGETPRGEFALVTRGRTIPKPVTPPSRADLDALLAAELAGGSPPTAIARELARRGYGERAELYARLVALKRT